MSEKLYLLLLRLYPGRFRTQYGAEAMQVLRDRLRDERGLLRRTRLWLDLLLDLTVSAPREHRRAASAPAAAPTGFPAFAVLDEEPLRPNMFVSATLLALIALGSFVFLMTHGGNRVLFPGMLDQTLRSQMAPAISATSADQPPAAISGGEAAEVPLVTPAERQLVIRKVIETVEAYDSHRGEAQQVADMLRARQTHGDYEALSNGSFFALLLTRQIGAVTHFVTVTVMCGEQPSPGAALWTRSVHPGASALRRIDDHFSVAIANRPAPAP